MTGNETRNELGHGTEGGPGIAAGQKIEITADEDWKSRVKAEDAAFDQQFQHADATATKAEAGEAARPPEPRTEARQASATREAPTLPEPSLATLLGMLSTQAMVALGLLPNPATRKAEKELPFGAILHRPDRCFGEEDGGEPRPRRGRRSRRDIAHAAYGLRSTFERDSLTDRRAAARPTGHPGP